jgi:flavin-dependent dehydrogenase
MPRRATKRGAERTSFGHRTVDVLICGASFAGLAVARELRGSGAEVLIVDRYEIGERQTSACAAPTAWLENLGLEASIKQTFDELVVHTPRVSARWPMPWTFSTFDYRHCCDLLWEQCGDAEFDIAKVDGRTHNTVHTDRGDITAELIVDALGWRRVLSNAEPAIQPPEARLSRGLEVHPGGSADDLEIFIEKRVIPAGYGWSFPAGDEVRIGVGSFRPADKVKEPTVELVERLGSEPDGYQGNWIPHQIRPAVEDGIFFVGDSAGHCIPLSAEGIRTALYFGIACGRELRDVIEGRHDRAAALELYGGFCAEHAWKFEWMLRWQNVVPRLRPRALDGLVRSLKWEKLCFWGFEHYRRIAPPEFALPAPPAPAPRERTPVAA